MLNENLENLNENLEIILIPLMKNDIINLELRFSKSTRKKYLIREALILNGKTVVSEQMELLKIKSFCKKFINNKINSSHENDFFKYVTKQNTQGDIIRSLKLKESNNIYFNEIDIESLLSLWSEALVGYNKIRVFDNNIILSTSTHAIELPKENFFQLSNKNNNIHNQIVKYLKNNEFNSSFILDLIKKH